MVESMVAVLMSLRMVKSRMVTMVFVSLGFDVVLGNRCRVCNKIILHSFTVVK